jgi:hemerythrin
VARSWNPKWKIGVAEIDAQHEELFDRFDHFVEEAADLDRIGAATEALHFLARYVDQHFKDEEQAMAGAGYPALAAHQALHRDFVAALDKLIVRFVRERSTPGFLEALKDHFERWLTGHIAAEDQRFGDHLGPRPS